ncbi:MAG: aspartate-semialdehyde dehydrogenase [Candidatus Limnocylindrales bacterium]
MPWTAPRLSVRMALPTNPQPTRPLTVAVVGASGAVGRTMLQVLLEREFPTLTLRALASERSAGTRISVGGQTLRVYQAGPASFAWVDIALFSAGAAASRALAPEAVAAGAVVVDNSSAWRMEVDVPLVVPEVNPEDAADHHGIVANPNCSTIQLVPPLMALRDAVGLERVVVDTYQSVSGTGQRGIDELETQIADHAAGRDPVASLYPHPVAFNALPEIDVFLEDGYSREEWKVIHESRKILHLPELRISCTAVRVPVFRAHSEAVHVETSRPLGPREARDLFAAVPGVVVIDDPAAHRYPLASEATDRDEIFVGRIRQDVSLPDGRGLAFWIVSDNLRKGAATNAVQIAELLARRGWLTPGPARGGGLA